MDLLFKCHVVFPLGVLFIYLFRPENGDFVIKDSESFFFFFFKAFGVHAGVRTELYHSQKLLDVCLWFRPLEK